MSLSEIFHDDEGQKSGTLLGFCAPITKTLYGVGVVGITYCIRPSISNNH
jgi:hypothetical protein